MTGDSVSFVFAQRDTGEGGLTSESKRPIEVVPPTAVGSGITDQDEESGAEEGLHQAHIEEELRVFEETHLGLQFRTIAMILNWVPVYPETFRLCSHSQGHRRANSCVSIAESGTDGLTWKGIFE